MGHRVRVLSLFVLRDETKTAVRETKKNAAPPPIICESAPPPRPVFGLFPGALLSCNFCHINENVKCLCEDKSNKKLQTHLFVQIFVKKRPFNRSMRSIMFC